ncbi:unnamed protein product [Ectocarpus sp. CCAP 1310/34]|nr:unnamed protein product [Ectocarpus sp. CCAP 1310/34]
MYDRRRANRQLKIRLLQAEVVETLLYGCASWSLTAEHYTKLNGTHRQFLTRCIGWSKRKRSDHPLSYAQALIQAGCEETIEDTVPKRRLELLQQQQYQHQQLHPYTHQQYFQPSSAAPQGYQQLAGTLGAAPVYNAHRFKEAQKLEGRTWEKDGQAVLFLLRGATFSPVLMTASDVDLIIREVAHPHPGLHSLLTLGSVDIAAFSPPRPAGVAAVTRTFDVHFYVFVSVPKLFIEDGMQGAPQAGRDRVGLFFRELQRMSEDLRRYISRHCAELKGRKADVFARFRQDANSDWADFISRVTTEARSLRQSNTLAPPPPNTMGAIQVPQFKRTLFLISEGSAHSMAGLMQGALARQQQQQQPKAATTSNKRKAASQATEAEMDAAAEVEEEGAREEAVAVLNRDGAGPTSLR